MSTTLKEALKVTSTSKNSSGKTPQFYSQQKSSFISEMAIHVDEIVRVAVASSDYVPTSILRTMLSKEQDEDVLRAILLNPRTPIKALNTFVKDPRAAAFNDDEEIGQAFAARVSQDTE